MNTPLPSVAIALYVKDEHSDIAGWISWHFALGVKTLFIYDDHSSDGTWEIIQAAAKIYDIRAERTSPETQPHFALRHRDSYFKAAKECAGKYDWVGFLDGDEYVYLRHYDSLPEFLSKFTHADAVGFSWKIYGSSNRVLRPRAPAPQVFTKHSTKDLGDNVLIKSFVRPEKMGPNWFNPHFYEVPKGRYVRPDGSFMRDERAEQPIEWDDAFIMHFITRSMTHYIERIRRRLGKDLVESQGYWEHFDKNDIEDREPLRLMPKVREILLPINDQMISEAIAHLKSKYSPLAKHVFPVTVKEVPHVYEVKTGENTSLYYSVGDTALVHATREGLTERGGEYVRVLAACYPSSPHIVTLYRADDSGAPIMVNSSLSVIGDERDLVMISFELINQDDGKVAFRSPLNMQVMSFPQIDSKFNFVPCDRIGADDWEKVELHEIKLGEKASVQLQDYALPDVKEVDIFERFISWLVSSPSLPDKFIFLRMLYAIDSKLRIDVSRHAPGLLHPFI